MQFFIDIFPGFWSAKTTLTIDKSDGLDLFLLKCTVTRYQGEQWGQLIALSWKHFTQFPAADLVSIDIKYIIHHNIINWLWDVESMKRLSLSVDSRYFWVTYNDYNVGIFSAKCQSAKVTILNGKWVTAFQTSLEIVLYGLK